MIYRIWRGRGTTAEKTQEHITQDDRSFGWFRRQTELSSRWSTDWCLSSVPQVRWLTVLSNITSLPVRENLRNNLGSKILSFDPGKDHLDLYCLWNALPIGLAADLLRCLQCILWYRTNPTLFFEHILWSSLESFSKRHVWARERNRTWVSTKVDYTLRIYHQKSIQAVIHSAPAA